MDRPVADEPVTTSEGIPQRRVYSFIVTGVGGTIVTSLLGAVAVRSMTTGLGTSAYGTFVIVQAFISLVLNFSQLGLVQVLQRDIAKGDQDEARLLSLAMGLRVTLAFLAIPLAGAIGFVAYSHHSADLKIGLLVALCTPPFAAISQVAAGHFNAQVRNAAINIIGLIQQATYVGLVIASVALHGSVVLCIAASVIGWVVSALLMVVMARREVTFSMAYDRAHWLSMLRISTPIGMAYVIGTFYLRADILILSVMSNTTQVGLYGVAYAVITFFLVLPSILTKTFLPGLVKASTDDIEGAVRTVLRYFAIGGTFAATGIMICGPTVVRLFAGKHFEGSVTPLRILGLGLIFIFVTSGLSSVSIARGFGNRLFVMSSISLVINVALNIAVIPTFGIVGSAAATDICEVIAMTFIAWLVHNETGIRGRPLAVLFRPVIAGAVTCAVLFPIYSRHSSSTAVGLALMPVLSVIYLFVLWVLRAYPSDLVASLSSLRVTARAKLHR